MKTLASPEWINYTGSGYLLYLNAVISSAAAKTPWFVESLSPPWWDYYYVVTRWHSFILMPVAKCRPALPIPLTG